MSIEVQGLESIQAKLGALNEHFSTRQTRIRLRTIGNMFKNVIDESFESERSPFGEKWAPLTIKTQQAKQRRAESSKILRASGLLSDTWLVDVEDDGVTISGNARSSKGYAYGKAHHYGSKHLKIRRFFPVDNNGKIEPRLFKTIDDYLNNHITNILKYTK